MDEISRFMNVWQQESAKTIALLKSLPSDQYNFRPDADGRSLGELAWHLAESDAYKSPSASNAGSSPSTESNRPVSSGRGKWSYSLRRTSAFSVTPSSA